MRPMSEGDGIALSQLVEGNPVATIVIDASHRVTHWNRACKNFCVNGHLAGNCRAPRSDDGRSKESSTEGVAGQPAG